VDELLSADELAAACGNDSLCVWAAQGLTQASGARAWTSGPAVLVACPGLSSRDRAVVWGEPAAAARLVAGAVPLLGPGYRLLGHGDLIPEVVRGLAGWAASAPFGWMYTPAHGKHGPGTPATDHGRPEGVRWLEAGDMPGVSELLERAFPDSYAWPGMAGVRRWAGDVDDDGGLAGVAADAWSAPTLGYMAGVAVRKEARGRGVGRRVCAFVLGDLIARHGRAALMVHGWNDPAIRLYQRLGLVFQPIRAGRPEPAQG